MTQSLAPALALAAHLAAPVLSCAVVTLLLVAAWSDITRRMIPNTVSLALASIGLALRFLQDEVPPAVAVATAAFAVLYLCWRRGLIGGGDVKLIAACLLLVSPAQALALVITISLSGGGLAVVYLGLGRWLARWPKRPSLAPPRRPRRQTFWLRRLLAIEAWRARRRLGLPYGIAIAAGTLATLSAGAPAPF